MPPDASIAGGLKKAKTPKLKPTLDPITMEDAYCGDATDQNLIETIMGVSKNSQLYSGDENENSGHPIRVSGCIDLGSLRLEPENVARVVPGRIPTVRFFPSTNMKLVAVGSEFGHVGFWNVDARNEDGDGIYLYQPHLGRVTGIVIHPYSLTKVYSSCYDGFLRLMDVEKEMFLLLYSSNDAIVSISQRPNDVKSLYFAGAQGIVNMWDERAGKALTPWVLHEERINTIDFSTDNTNIMATSSSDGTACIWDLRFVDAVKPKLLKTVSHNKAVQSAYFSPSGSCLATTGSDDKVGLVTGANFEDTKQYGAGTIHTSLSEVRREKSKLSPQLGEQVLELYGAPIYLQFQVAWMHTLARLGCLREPHLAATCGQHAKVLGTGASFCTSIAVPSEID
ncbi:hypothetical protein RHMOL_Rhmol01G0040600 [Rhododendron molle]|uniref:Uncharacterized protein n=1 Tax=Rhododendron molle TaxID=49168 RepID=A0ACC0Q162_RHOML|nr:hypothetical protein RHMOL_Rhmol01G0040600 [Rhododendron molle]